MYPSFKTKYYCIPNRLQNSEGIIFICLYEKPITLYDPLYCDIYFVSVVGNKPIKSPRYACFKMCPRFVLIRYGNTCRHGNVMKEEICVLTVPWKQKACRVTQGDLGNPENQSGDSVVISVGNLVISVGKAR